MFEEMLGLPAHPLVVHAAVVFVPLLVLMATAYVVLPFVRTRFAWAVMVFVAVTPATVWLARETGERFERRLNARVPLPKELADEINAHQGYAGMLFWSVCALSVVTVLFVALDMGRRRVNNNAAPPAYVGGPPQPVPAARGRFVIMLLLGILVLALSVASGWYVYKTGDSGARMVWEGS